jgi:hypothetical protein
MERAESECRNGQRLQTLSKRAAGPAAAALFPAFFPAFFPALFPAVFPAVFPAGLPGRSTVPSGVTCALAVVSELP